MACHPQRVLDYVQPFTVDAIFLAKKALTGSVKMSQNRKMAWIHEYSCKDIMLSELLNISPVMPSWI